VVDQSAHDTFRYDVAGNFIADNNLTGRNSRPRGVASNAAGNTVWVVDANKTVLSTRPTALCAAPGRPRLNQPQDVTTNGTDVWIVDNASNRVYRYANAAGAVGVTVTRPEFRSRFANRNPTGLVIDGTTIWVTDDHGDPITKTMRTITTAATKTAMTMTMTALPARRCSSIRWRA